ncbi:radical SAM family RiPP maturation amino acid epimerase [Butyrivibrio sp. ob235]|uniref:radical SAM family RiPP maturation amino acid epimerase n=1 Tax=Butyrivibrio sp. ob235 TaxID=1761780 RepID=UPI0008C6C499|nr:radical SAM family RiPP maturation amino acid epimerase [Butyrivibrio sp. ob235]SEL90208.1 radical SAM family RiPP maturation amino acid epimerase [Butyrivibrio sp. ob235]
MNEHELSLIDKNLNEMSPQDSSRIMLGLSNAKRLIDVTSIIPGARDEYISDKKSFLEKYGIELSVEDADFLICPANPKEKLQIISDPKRISEMPESFFRYRQFYGNKLAFRDKMINELCVPDNEKLKKWRLRQKRRCDGELGGLNESFVHTVVTYELASGCSVGCPFCGLDAGPLKELFRYTPENSKLFGDVIRVCHKVVGDAAGNGMMYFATEPLDNPDYEKFEKDFYNEFHIVPQITTAVFDRDIERTRYFVNELSKGMGFIHRFTIRSLEMARSVFENFSAPELLMVELLPQFPEAPSFAPYVKAGRETENEHEPIADTDPGTICCVDGFCINFPEKKFKLISPVRACERFPKGIYESEWIGFSDGDDFEEKLKAYIEEKLEIEIPQDNPLKLYDYMDISEYKNAPAIVSKYGEAIPLKEPYMVRIAELLKEGKYTRKEIAGMVMKENITAPENAYWYLNRLWDNGCIIETIFL